jgi:hypothetical protein
MNWQQIKNKYPVNGQLAFDFCKVKPFNRNVYDYFDSRRLYVGVIYNDVERNFHGWIHDRFQCCYQATGLTRIEVETDLFFKAFDILERF